MKSFFQPLKELPAYGAILRHIEEENTPVLVTGVIDVQKIHFLSAILEESNRPGLVITHSNRRAEEMADDLRFFGETVLTFPVRDFLAYRADARSMEGDRVRLRSLASLCQKQKKPVTVVLSVEALFDRLLPKEVFAAHRITISEGDTLDYGKLGQNLIYMGYERTEQVEAVGQFAVRGGILDVFSPGAENPLRIELWGDEVDSLRYMDVVNQRSLGRAEEGTILPVKEVFYDEDDVETMVSKLDKALEKGKAKLEAQGLSTAHVEEMAERFRQTGFLQENSLLLPFLPVKTVSLLEYLPKNTVIFFDDPSAIRIHADQVETIFAESMKNRLEGAEILPEQANPLFSYAEILQKAEGRCQVLFSAFAQSAEGFRLKGLVSMTAAAMPSFRQQMDLLAEELAFQKREGYRVLILGGSEARCTRLIQELRDRGIEGALAEHAAEASLQKGVITVAPGNLTKGFQYPDIKLAIFCDNEIFGEAAAVRKPKKKKKGAAIQSFTDLRVGDYVVHDNHGIGIFRGLETITNQGISKEYMKISYADGGNLFIPINQLDMLQKYIGGEGSKPKLNKLGGEAWNKAKTKARAAVALLAEDLVALYAKRQKSRGFSYSSDTLWQKEFEDTFPYEETGDQLSAVEDVKRDMEAGKVMDRLICGDVGYGKTEVALRAAFKAVQDGKQVAVLVPTTILAQQHTLTFTGRMSDYPIVIRQLSRFTTPKEQKETLKGLETGQVDIVVGTHRLLSKDLKFKDLGLLIVDEEQRFGVAHKDKLKALKENVNVLTLSATPIPRTLHMSLSGIRDMSLLEEPPRARHPVQTYVLENNKEFVREAIYRELDRGGQVYYLHNRVSNIGEEAARVQALVPDAKVGYAHGRMSERELETVMKSFMDRELDVLVCTTIVENGLDIPNVNTIIVQDADRLGLSQLYQLRGRVGRSDRVAYAYLLYRPNKVLTETAAARLSTIREFTAFGSGFKIAMRDLEIRGAGNFLGGEQHGHMEAVGYDLYCRLLDEEVRKLKGENVEEEFETSVDLSVTAFLPDFYIQNEEQRLELYQRIAFIKTEDDYFDVQEELLDRFGDMPKSVGMLLDVALCKARAHQLGAIGIVQKQNKILFTFRGDAAVNTEGLAQLLQEGRGRYGFTAGVNPVLTATLRDGDKPLEIVEGILDAII